METGDNLFRRDRLNKLGIDDRLEFYELERLMEANIDNDQTTAFYKKVYEQIMPTIVGIMPYNESSINKDDESLHIINKDCKPIGKTLYESIERVSKDGNDKERIWKLAPGTRFANQPARIQGTGYTFMIKDVVYILTAAHNITDFVKGKQRNIAIVNGFKYEGPGRLPNQINKERWFTLENKHIVSYKYTAYEDWALIKLPDSYQKNAIDASLNPGQNKSKLNSGFFYSSKIKNSDQKLSLTQPNLFTAGHPNGIPLKFADNASFKGTLNHTTFLANLDAYSGCSGSPVFSFNIPNETKKEIDIFLEGIVIGGMPDYHMDTETGFLVEIPEAEIHGLGEKILCLSNIKKHFNKGVLNPVFELWIKSERKRKRIKKAGKRDEMSTNCKPYLSCECNYAGDNERDYYYSVLIDKDCEVKLLTNMGNNGTIGKDVDLQSSYNKNFNHFYHYQSEILINASKTTIENSDISGKINFKAVSPKARVRSIIIRDMSENDRDNLLVADILTNPILNDIFCTYDSKMYELMTNSNKSLFKPELVLNGNQRVSSNSTDSNSEEHQKTSITIKIEEERTKIPLEDPDEKPFKVRL